MDTASKTPWHLWAVGLVSLLWNGFGAYDYLMSKTGNREYLAGMMEPTGVSVDAAIAYMDAMPLWANIAWGLGVWGAVAGSILLLQRSRHALTAFAASLLGLIFGMIHQWTNPMPEMTDPTTPIIFSFVITVITVFLLLYTRRMIGASVLR